MCVCVCRDVVSDGGVSVFTSHISSGLGRWRHSHKNSTLLLRSLSVQSEQPQLSVWRRQSGHVELIFNCILTMNCRALLRLQQWQNWFLMLADQRSAQESG